MLWAGYTRVSRVGDRADTLISPELQRNRIEAFAASKGIDVVMLDPELDVSGGKTDRPVLNDAIAGVGDGRYAGIVVAQLDRLSRLSLLDALTVIRRVEDAGGQVIAVAEDFDATTPEGNLSRNVMLSLADMQLKRYRAQFATVRQRTVEQGIWPATHVPLGYSCVRRKHGGDGKLVPDPKTAPIVVRAFEARAAGESWSAVGRILGRGLSGAAKIVSNRVYLGEIRAGEWTKIDAHPALVGHELFAAAQIQHARPARGKHAPALLGGLTRCASCGFALTPGVSKSSRDYRCMVRPTRRERCSARAFIAMHKLDDYVQAVVLAHLARVDFSTSERDDEVRQAADDLARVEAELDAFQRATAVADVGAEHFASGLTQRVRAVEDARAQLARLRLASPPSAMNATLAEAWPDLSLDERRHVLRSCLSAVVVSPGSGPASERVRIVAAGFPVPGPVGPDDDIDGQISPAHHVG